MSRQRAFLHLRTILPMIGAMLVFSLVTTSTMKPADGQESDPFPGAVAADQIDPALTRAIGAYVVSQGSEYAGGDCSLFDAARTQRSAERYCSQVRILGDGVADVFLNYIIAAPPIYRHAGIVTFQKMGSDWVPVAGRAVPAQDPQDDVDAALAAALKLYNAVRAVDCAGNNPRQQFCVEMQSDAGSASRGIAVFGVGDPSGIGGFVGVLARDPTGEWRLWLQTQNVTPPAAGAAATVCTGGDLLNVRYGPSLQSPIATTLPDGTTVQTEEFVLDKEGTSSSPGFGWYRLSAPAAGWVSSQYLTRPAAPAAVGGGPACGG